jgi:hypothetical protein
MRYIVAIVGMALAAIGFAPSAQATDYMYMVGVHIPVGTFSYRVVESDWGSWKLCGDPNCNDLIDIEVIDGYGSTGYMEVTPNARFVLLNNLYMQGPL